MDVQSVKSAVCYIYKRSTCEAIYVLQFELRLSVCNIEQVHEKTKVAL